MKPFKYTMLVVMSLVMLYPILHMIIGSFQELNDIMVFPPRLIPRNLSLDNYRLIFSRGLPVMICNTAAITALTVLINVSVTVLTGYALAASGSRGKFFMIALFIPGNFIFISQFIVIRHLGLINNYFAVALPAAYNVIHIILCRNYIRAIPAAICESAKIDGAGELVIITRIVLPMIKPMVATVAIFIALHTQVNYLWQMITIRKTKLLPMLTGVIQLVNSDFAGQPNKIGLQLAGGVILFIPVLLIFLFGSRYFVKDLMLGGEK